MTKEQAKEILWNRCQHTPETEEAIRVLSEERPQSEWIKGREISRTMLGGKVEHIDYRDYTCSNCGLVLNNLLYYHDGSPFYKFCPNCGAKMRKGGAE